MDEVDLEFVEYLRSQLIPDLRRDGFEATAEDFETCLEIISKLESGV